MLFMLVLNEKYQDIEWQRPQLSGSVSEECHRIPFLSPTEWRISPLEHQRSARPNVTLALEEFIAKFQ